MNISSTPLSSTAIIHPTPLSLPSNDVSDEDLLIGITQQDMQAIEILYDRYAGALYALVFRIVKDGIAAEGLVQETFLKVWQKAGEYTGVGAPGAWIFRIARNKALDHLRRGKVRPVSSEKELESHYTLTDSESDTSMTHTEIAVEQIYHRDHLRSALAELPAEQRQCLELAYFEGMTQTEIALHTHAPLGTIKTRIKMGLHKMERLLRSYGYTNALGIG